MFTLSPLQAIGDEFERREDVPLAPLVRVAIFEHAVGKLVEDLRKALIGGEV